MHKLITSTYIEDKLEFPVLHYILAIRLHGGLFLRCSIFFIKVTFNLSLKVNEYSFSCEFDLPFLHASLNLHLL